MFVIYDEAGGIVSTIAGPGLEYGRDYLDKEGKRWLFLEGVTSLDPLQNYVDMLDGKVKPRRPMHLVIDGAVISNIPPNSIAHISVAEQLQASETITDGELELDVETPASYLVLLTCAGYLPAEIEIDLP
jgi:hypothetical protein